MSGIDWIVVGCAVIAGSVVIIALSVFAKLCAESPCKFEYSCPSGNHWIITTFDFPLESDCQLHCDLCALKREGVSTFSPAEAICREVEREKK